ncbi:MAG: Ig-like domain-containing protein [Candidatus Hydrogenedentes bacterium]|nr:Ig-like domain-containing protein [Candidatus Hydrogenedentota bacterium]
MKTKFGLSLVNTPARLSKVSVQAVVALVFVGVLSVGIGSCISITPSFLRLEVGGTAQLRASSGFDSAFTWRSTNLTVASVNPDGVVTGLSEGFAYITATGNSSGYIARIRVDTVGTGQVISISISPRNPTVTVGDLLRLSATSTDPLDTEFDWTSDRPEFATVLDDGTVTPVAPGTAVITATGSHSGAHGTTSVTVVARENRPPVANAGLDATGTVSRVVGLDGTGSSDPDGDALTYLWTQVGGPAATLTGATTSRPAFLPFTVGQYILQLIVNDGELDSVPDQVVITVQEEAPGVSIRIDGVSETDIENRGLTTGPSSGLDTVGVGTSVYLIADVTGAKQTANFSWSILAAPQGSTATFDNAASASPVLVPDREGIYDLSVTVTDGAKALVGTAQQRIFAGQWVGEGTQVGQSACAACHNDVVAPGRIAPWLETAHATKFIRHIDGELGGFYAESCLECHTVGYDTSPTAVNNGFDDVAAALGWTIPQPLQPGNWEAMVEQFPSLARLANIQCENCHGPASQHPASAFDAEKKIDVSLNSGVCGQCHHQEVQWETSPHADEDALPFNYAIGPGAENCVRCHSGVGFIDFTQGVTPPRTNKQVHSCGVCHDPHDATRPVQLRAYDEITLPSGTVVNDIGAAAACISCHNGRQKPQDALTNQFPHFSTAAENLLGINAVTYGRTLQNSPHRFLVADLCVGCHMADTPGEPRDGVTDPGEDLVGEHTFRMATDSGTPGDPTDDFINIQNACSACHPTETSFNCPATGDFDGNGRIQGVQDEVRGLLAVVENALAMTSAPLEARQKATYNHELVLHDGSFGVHNTAFSVGLLQLTYRELTGQDVPGATLRY